MSYQAPASIIEVMASLEVTEALGADDPRFVQTQEARGSQKTLKRLAMKYGLSLADNRLLAPPLKHVLFFGHVGSGKTTELRQYAQALHGPERLFVVEVDLSNNLDRNDLQYAETLMLMARTLLERVQSEGLGVGIDRLQELQAWFAERVLSSEQARDFSLEVKSGAEIKAEVPFFAKLFSSMTAAFRTNASYKDSLRTVLRNSFKPFADIFNRLLRDTEQRLAARGLGRRVLFIVDGTDKLRGDDTLRFFVHDAEQLLAIETLALYTAPISLKYEGNLAVRLDADIVLPMIKPAERDGTPCQAGQDALRDILLRRADRALFSSDAEVEQLVAACGGHPRELLRLLKLCCEFSESAHIDAETVGQAVKQLASEYRRFLDREDYALLQQLDADDVHSGNDDRTRRLLYNLALMEYDDGSWRRSHPVVRTLEGYRHAAASAAAALQSQYEPGV